MGKLVFKGEKKKKSSKIREKKVESGSCTTRNVGLGESHPKSKIGASDIGGWSTCLDYEDLKGPCIILNGSIQEHQKRFYALSLTNNALVTSESLARNENSINFFDKEKYSEIHYLEPDKVNQVFVLVPIKSFESSVLSNRQVQTYALKTYNNLYLSTTGLPSHAIGTTETFTLKKSSEENSEFGIEETFWSIEAGGKILKVSETASGDIMPSFEPDTPGSSKAKNSIFVIRVQCQNTLRGSQLLLASEESKFESSDQELGYYVRQLYKDTKGKLKIDKQLLDRLKTALENGNINEQLIIEKSSINSRW